MIKVVDKFIPEQYQDELESIISSDKFLWSYQPCTYISFINKDTSQYNDVPFLGRQLSNDNRVFEDYNLILPLVYFFMEHTGLTVIKVVRSKVNCVLPSADKRRHPPHTDCRDSKSYTLLYYINDSDGDTIIFNEFNDLNGLTVNTSITPKKGRAVIFPANQLHCGNNPSNNRRLAINIVITVE